MKNTYHSLIVLASFTMVLAGCSKNSPTSIVGNYQPKEATKASAEVHNQTNSVAHRPGTYISIDQLASVGYATPEAALESVMWAMTYGTYEQANAGLNPEMLTNELTDTHGREQFEAFQKKEAKMVKGIQIVAKKVLSVDKVELKIKQNKDPEPEYMLQPMVKIGDEWKLGDDTREYTDSWITGGQIQTFTP